MSDETIVLDVQEYKRILKEREEYRGALQILATILDNRKGAKACQIRGAISSQLRETIAHHGPITDKHGDIGSATKRVSGQVMGLLSNWAKTILAKNTESVSPNKKGKYINRKRSSMF